jgi:hypothetical protein
MEKQIKINEAMGYYTCDNKKFGSKIQACIYGTMTKKPVNWHFNQEVFEKYPWHIEPEETLDQLYDRRARELREKYDYILLAFSGGADSNNILEAFLRQGLHIDEIVTNVMDNRNSMTVLDRTCIDSWNETAEFQLQTLPRLKYVEKVSPKTKISILDLSNYVFQFFNEHGDESWLDYTRERLNVSGLMRHNFLHFKEIRKKFDKDKKITMILGVEKPRTYIKDGVFKLMFIDKAVNIATVQEFIGDYTNSEVEYFYNHPDCAAMICKQAHVIKKWVEVNPQRVSRWTPRNLAELFKSHRLVHERVLRNLIYTTWNDQEYWQANKSTLDWFSQIDDWFTKGHRGTREYGIWEAGLKYVRENAKDYLKGYYGSIDSDNSELGLVPFLNIYEIGPVKRLSRTMGNPNFPKWEDL